MATRRERPLDDERVVVGLRPHGRVLLGPVLVLFVVAPVTAFVAASVPDGRVAGTIRLLVLAAGLLVVLRGSVLPFLEWRRTRYVVTDRRVAVRRGLVRRTGRDVPLARVTEVAVRTTAWDRALRTGRIRVVATGETSPFVLHDVPAVEDVADAVRRYAGLDDVDAEDLDAEDADPDDGDVDTYDEEPYDDGPYDDGPYDDEAYDEPYAEDDAGRPDDARPRGFRRLLGREDDPR